MSSIFKLGARFYRTSRGTEPVRDWLKSLAKADKRKIGEDIKTVQTGYPVGMPLVKKIDANLWEVRSNVTNGIARVLFTVIGNEMILLHGLIKKTQRLLPQDVQLAKKRKREVLKGGGA